MLQREGANTWGFSAIMVPPFFGGSHNRDEAIWGYTKVTSNPLVSGNQSKIPGSGTLNPHNRAHRQSRHR